MSFDTLDEVKEFYKTYAHESGFLVHIGAESKKTDVVDNKRFVCSREGFIKRCVEPNKQKEALRDKMWMQCTHLCEVGSGQ
jgi:hypothetical protein